MESIEHFQKINKLPNYVYAVLTTEKGLSEVWTNDLKVNSQIGAILEFRFGDNDESKMEVVELVPNYKITWKCIESDDAEWIGTIISFELEEKNGTTEITFRHTNWREMTTCYRFCNYNWAMFLYSLKEYCEVGKGQPYQKRKF